MQEIRQILDKSRELISRGQKFLIEQKLREKISEFEKKMDEPNFWNNRTTAEKIGRELAHARKTIETWDTLDKERSDLAELVQLTNESDIAAISELSAETTKFEQKLHDAEITLFLNGKFDAADALLTIHVGAGGIDAADWAAMLLRMFLRFAEKKSWQTEILEKSEADEAGIKSATIEIRGNYAYGFLKSEKGSHRLVRRSPFNSAHSRETSFAKVEVLPITPDNNEIVIRNEDLKIDTFCASGAGGQHVNRTESAVRITHLPTGIAVSCQNQRSQQQNKIKTMEILHAKLTEHEAEKAEVEARKLRGEPPKADFGGNTIRSYILDDKRVKDTRTGVETHDPERVLDGDLEEFVRAFLTKTPK